MRTTSKRVVKDIVARGIGQSERRGEFAAGYGFSIIFAALLLSFTSSAFSQSLAITSPAASQNISGVSFPLTVALTSLPSVASVEYLVDGESQGIVWSAPWSIPSWNTNNRYNGPAHAVVAIARNALGAVVGTSPTITFSISNAYLEPPSYINLVSVTPSTSINSTWSGVVSLTAVFNGTNATNAKTITVFVDGDYSGSKSLNESNNGSAATTMYVALNTFQYSDGAHEVCLEVRDIAGDKLAPTIGGYPFGEWCQSVAFANTSTILLVNSIVNADYPCWAGGSCTSVSSYAAPASGTVNVTSGNAIVVCGSDFGGGSWTLSTDALGNSYTAVNSGITESNWKSQCFLATNITGGADSWTLNFGGSVSRPALLVREYSGVATSSAIDAQNSSGIAAPASCLCVIPSGTITTTNANDMLITYSLAPGVVGYGPGLNSTLDNPTAHTINYGAGTSQLLASTISGGTATFSANLSSATYGVTVLALKAASSTPVSSPSDVLLSPKDWVIPPGGTIQLTPTVANTDGTTTAVTSGMNPIYTWNNSATCTVSPTGLVTGVAFGSCAVTVVIGNAFTETIYGWVSSTNVVPFFGTDGRIHTSGGTPIWVASAFNSTPFGVFQDTNKTALQIGTAYQNAGYNTIENGPTDGNALWGTSCSNFQSALNTYINAKTSILSQFGFYFHAPATTLVTGFPSQFFVGVRGIGATCTPQSWQYLAQQWAATGRLLGIELGDEFDADYGYPAASPVISSNGPFTGGSCNTATPVVCTFNYSNPTVDYSGPNKFAIFGATTNSVLNSTVGTPGTTTTLYNYSTKFSSTFSFQAPAGASGITVTPASDPTIRIEPFAYEWETGNGGGGDYQHYQDFMTLSALVHAGGAALSAAPRAIASSTAQCGWGGLCTAAGSPPFSDYAVIYNQPAAFGTAQYVALATLRISPNNVIPQNRAYINGAGALRAFLGQTQGIAQNYGLNGQVVTGMSCVGSLCTWPSPHGIYNLVPYVTRVTFSGSANPYFNGNFYIDTCPTATTCTISRQSTTQAGLTSSIGGTITFANGNVFTSACPEASMTLWVEQNPTTCAGISSLVAHNVGSTFTMSGAQGSSAAYWNSNTFILSGYPYPYPNPAGNQAAIREVPPVSQVSGSMTGTVIVNNWNVRGQNQSVYGEIVQGPRIPFAFVMAQAITGATGHRLYIAGEDYNADNTFFAGANAFGFWNCNSSIGDNCLQAGSTLFYDEGADLVRFFNSATNANLILERMASAGYLYAPRGSAPDIGFNIESSLRQGSKGNLLLTMSFQDGAQSHPLSLAACDVPGQKKIRYTLDWRSITVTEIGAGTITDTPTWPAGGAVIYLCPNNESLEYAPPVIASLLADAPGAAKIVVQYAYSPYLLNKATGNVIDCGGGVCVLPVDRNIGPLYYRLQYLDANGLVLATSDMQTL